jgi:hypothetical protein
MSTFGISRISTLLLATVVAFALTASHSAAAGLSQAVCGEYAEASWHDVDDMNRGGCEESGYLGPGRFSRDLNHHRDWCLKSATPQTLKFERETRRAARDACLTRKLKEMVCDSYANDAVKMSNQYQINRCTTEHHPTGRFDYRYQHHYNWCMYTANAGAPIYSENDARTAELDACKQRNEEAQYTPIKKLKIKPAPEQESADADESSEEPESVDIAETSDEPAFEPAPKRRTQVIVIGNRYTEVPAFDEEPEVADEGSRVGSVVKAGAAAVVVGTAAVATGAVAAKALDYADDYKGGINKAMSGAKEALKEKIKDRFDGGGINKAMSGAKETLKEKVKDRFDGGGINKVATGVKEKLKDRLTGGGGVSKAASGLKERVKEKFKTRLTGGGGGGLGSKMKGIAKAGGGLLRRLAGR